MMKLGAMLAVLPFCAAVNTQKGEYVNGECATGCALWPRWGGLARGEVRSILRRSQVAPNGSVAHTNACVLWWPHRVVPG